MSIRSFDELCQRDQVIAEVAWSPFRSNSNESAGQQRARQRRANRDAAFTNEFTRKMKAAEIKDAKVKKQKRK